ncbi:DNA methyltransferase [Nitrosovibrio sp. Nv6]|uniref:DNA methyltransferase n=1 Tax=Nitrosovibrio sp. Nv6 TaxID=1855340 RepID=UPI0008B8461B|nr:DNA methyltransferase [Nitrosovibrio sp. Nv6]SEP43830.1 site-specific DNA-methyltransferase (adenine-specific) [Nitrosovibrio sp. Nv6]
MPLSSINHLYYGDNLVVLREHIADESIDLVYLDPPFNSQATYNVLFKGTSGEKSKAQIEAFEDTWHWNDSAEAAFDQVMSCGNSDVSEVLRALRSCLKENDMMAYLTMMAVRLLELHRVLKSTGSLYLHCDPTASHYLKILLDSIFSPLNFRNEIIWRRTGSHNKSEKWGPLHDVILFYSASDTYVWNHPKQPYMRGHVDAHFEKDEFGYKTAYYGNVLTGSGLRKGESGKPWRGFDPSAKQRHWAIPGKLWEDSGFDDDGLTQHQKLDALYEAGFVRIISGQAWPVYERRIRDGEGPATGDIWSYQPYTEGTVFETEEGVDNDVSWIKPSSKERLGYPTQKPLGLLERIIHASSNIGDTILDPFCGCGTTIHASQKLRRKWVGIDITHLAISLIEKRLTDAFPDVIFDVHGTPKDLSGAAALAAADKYQFQWWAVSLVNAIPYGGKKKGADSGIDGIIYFKPDGKTTEKAIVSVKGGDSVSVPMIRDLGHVIGREKAKIGVFITLNKPTKPMNVEAIKAGYYETYHGKFPKIQILTIEELFAGKKPNIPLIDQTVFKKAVTETKEHQNKLF